MLLKMITGELIGIIFGMIIIESLGQSLIRKFSDDSSKIYFFIIGWVCYLGVLYLLYKSYDYVNTAVANALWSAGTIISMALIGKYYFEEDLNKYEIGGLVVIITGILILGFFEDTKN